MATNTLHADEVETDASLVRRLLAVQFPQWAGLPIRTLEATGTDNAIYRLGENMTVRLPRRNGDTQQMEKEFTWLPRFAPLLPLAISLPLARGAPGEGYPWEWSVYRWLDGENAAIAQITDLAQAARDLARFINTLQRIDPAGGPLPGEHNFFRGGPLAGRDAETRDAIAALANQFDAATLTNAWEAALNTPEWEHPPVWIHADLQPLNLLVQNGRLSAIIDFGGLSLGDPACDVMPAWSLFTADTRPIFREALAVDDATWARGRGWALSVALIALPYYQPMNHALATISQRTIEEVLVDHARRA